MVRRPFNGAFTYILLQLGIRFHTIRKATLKQCAESRADTCLNFIRVDVQSGKHMINSILHGAAIPIGFEKNEFLMSVSSLARFLRWFACSCLPEVYTFVKDCKEKTHPDRSTFFYLWSSIESEIMDVVTEHFTSDEFSHISLHYDGVRVRPKSQSVDIEEHCTKCQQKVKESTGYEIRLRRKFHCTFFDGIALKAHNKTQVPKDPIFSVPGNCIPAAIAHLRQELHVLERISDDTNVQNAQAKDRGCRSYFDCTHMFGIKLVATRGLALQGDGRYLLHAESDGIPHCVSVRLQGDTCEVTDGINQFQIDKTKLTNAYTESIDRTSVVTFHENSLDVTPDDASAVLLDLQAGGKRERVRRALDSDSEDDHDPTAASSSATSTTRSMSGEYTDETFDMESSEVVVTSEVAKVMAVEIREYMTTIRKSTMKSAVSCSSGSLRCELCPFRSFDRRNRLIDHVTRYHTEQSQFVCSGTKQLKVRGDIED